MGKEEKEEATAARLMKKDINHKKNIPETIVNLMKMLYQDFASKVICNVKLSEAFTSIAE